MIEYKLFMQNPKKFDDPMLIGIPFKISSGDIRKLKSICDLIDLKKPITTQYSFVDFKKDNYEFLGGIGVIGIGDYRANNRTLTQVVFRPKGENAKKEVGNKSIIYHSPKSWGRLSVCPDDAIVRFSNGQSSQGYKPMTNDILDYKCMVDTYQLGEVFLDSEELKLETMLLQMWLPIQIEEIFKAFDKTQQEVEKV